jgi:hypothetical protein
MMAEPHENPNILVLMDSSNPRKGHEKLGEEEFLGGFFLCYFSREGEEKDDEF